VCPAISVSTRWLWRRAATYVLLHWCVEASACFHRVASWLSSTRRPRGTAPTSALVARTCGLPTLHCPAMVNCFRPSGLGAVCAFLLDDNDCNYRLNPSLMRYADNGNLRD